MGVYKPEMTANATETNRGIAELATQVETDAGTDDERIVTPLKVAGSKYNPLGQQTVVIPAAAMLPEDGAAGPELTTIAGTNLDYRLLLFDGAATETAFFTFQSPKGADETVAMVAEVSYEPRGTSSGNVRWQISALARGDGEATDASFGTAVANDSAAGTDNGVTQRSGEITFTPGGTWAAEDDIHVKLERLGGHANDTNTDDCGLKVLRIHYTIAAATDA